MIEYKVIPETNDKYECSKCGRVRRVKGMVKNSPSGGLRSVGGKDLSQKTKKNGYKEVNLYCKPHNSKMQYVHRLIAKTWIGEIPDTYNVNHIDGDKSNNHVSNLEIVTPSENRHHSYHVLGNKLPIRKGEDHPRSKLTNKDALQIREYYSKGITPTEISEKTGVPFSTVCKIAYRKTWKHI